MTMTKLTRAQRSALNKAAFAEGKYSPPPPKSARSIANKAAFAEMNAAIRGAINITPNGFLPSPPPAPTREPRRRR
jgi:hypothetical protein